MHSLLLNLKNSPKAIKNKRQNYNFKRKKKHKISPTTSNRFSLDNETYDYYLTDAISLSHKNQSEQLE